MTETAGPKPTIVIVEDDLVVRETISLVLRRKRRPPAHADGEEPLADGQPPSNCIVLDPQRSGRAVCEVLEDLITAADSAPILIVSGRSDLRATVRTLGDGALQALSEAAVRPHSAGKPRLTPREREVLSWVARGKSAWEIAAILGIAKRTVDEHVATAMRNLGAANRVHAVMIALRERLIDA
jgi:DNA-binding NarL/FixJ family response regulator